jgi:prepilin-type N-terminal cleavage/methylation domain-containing protein
MKHRGFTLIELIVVMAVTIILSGMSLAAYYRFSQRQAAKNDARNVVTEMKKVQALAKNLVYPAGCDSELSKYQLNADCWGLESCKSMTILAFCDNVPFTVKANEVVLTKAFFTDEISIDFAAGTGTIIPTGSFPLTNTADGYTVVVTIDHIGNISTKEYEKYPP